MGDRQALVATASSYPWELHAAWPEVALSFHLIQASIHTFLVQVSNILGTSLCCFSSTVADAQIHCSEGWEAGSILESLTASGS